MASTTPTTETLIAQIEQAFAEVAFPGVDRLTDSSYGEEPAALVKAFGMETDWRRLQSAFLNQAPDGWASALSFFSAAALQFYLPAYLIADLRGQLDRVDPAVRLCSFVAPQLSERKLAGIWGGGTLGDYARPEFARFTPQQTGAIVAYLWWRLERDGDLPLIEQALENYWLDR